MHKPVDLAPIHRLIQEGKRTQAKSVLKALDRRRLPRDQIAEVASLARRADLPDLALRLLNPIVRPDRRLPRMATPEEVAQYGACLAYVGAVEEALSLLKGVSMADEPQALLYQVFALVSHWRYGETIPLLERYLKLPKVKDYDRRIGAVNLAAAYTHERDFLKAGAILAKLRRETEKDKLWLLHGNCLELSAQVEILQRNWREANALLGRAELVLESAGGFDIFFVEKWRAIARLLATKKTTAGFNRVRGEARRRGHWETLRDLDRYSALATHDRGLLAQVCFGTPFPAFAKRACLDFGEGAELPDSYEWRLQPGRGAVVIDVARGEVVGARRSLKPGRLPHRLFSILASDFYRPFRIAAIHDRLFPGQHFNPVSGPYRVHQPIKLLRSSLKRLRWPIEISVGFGFSLSAIGPCTLKVTRSGLDSPSAVLIEKLRAARGEAPLGCGEFCERLGLPRMTGLRRLREACEQGLMEREGRGPATIYKFKKAG